MNQLRIIGGGLAGCEAAWQAANHGIRVVIYEMRTSNIRTHAHTTDSLAELVCSNSFRSDDATTTAIGLLHQEMRLLGSLIIQCADNNRIPAGGALAMDREAFATAVQSAITSHPNIRVVRAEVAEVPNDPIPTILATGPLTSAVLAKSIQKITGEDYMAFFDAIAPIIYKDSIDFNIAWMQSRYDKNASPDLGSGNDYINCPLDKEQYYSFVDALIMGEKTEFKEWEKNTPYFEGCLPIEVMAERGIETLRFGPMKPVGLTNPNSTERPYAVIQLRQDNKLGTLYNIVGFQTKLKYAEQTRIFRTIPGLQNAEFARLGGIHRNSFIKSPLLLDQYLRLKTNPKISFAGQITGVEGYVESAASGLLAGMFKSDEILGLTPRIPPKTTAIGALLAHVTENAEISSFQPMNINFGLMPEFEKKVKKFDRKKAYTKRAMEDLKSWLLPEQQ